VVTRFSKSILPCCICTEYELSNDIREGEERINREKKICTFKKAHKIVVDKERLSTSYIVVLLWVIFRYFVEIFFKLFVHRWFNTNTIDKTLLCCLLVPVIRLFFFASEQRRDGRDE